MGDHIDGDHGDCDPRDCLDAYMKPDPRDAELAALREELRVAKEQRDEAVRITNECNADDEQERAYLWEVARRVAPGCHHSLPEALDVIEREHAAVLAEREGLREQRDQAVALACKFAQACIDSARFNRGASFSIADTDEVNRLVGIVNGTVAP